MIDIINLPLFRYGFVKGEKYRFLQIFLEPAYSDVKCKLSIPKVVLFSDISDTKFESNALYCDLSHLEARYDQHIHEIRFDGYIRKDIPKDVESDYSAASGLPILGILGDCRFENPNSDSSVILADTISGRMPAIQKSPMYRIYAGSLVITNGIHVDYESERVSDLYYFSGKPARVDALVQLSGSKVVYLVYSRKSAENPEISEYINPDDKEQNIIWSNPEKTYLLRHSFLSVDRRNRFPVSYMRKRIAIYEMPKINPGVIPFRSGLFPVVPVVD